MKVSWLFSRQGSQSQEQKFKDILIYYFMVEGPRACQARNNAKPGCWNSMQAVYSEVGWASRGKNGQSSGISLRNSIQLQFQRLTKIIKITIFFLKNGNTTHRKLLDKKQYMLGKNVPSKNIYFLKKFYSEGC